MVSKIPRAETLPLNSATDYGVTFSTVAVISNWTISRAPLIIPQIIWQ